MSHLAKLRAKRADGEHGFTLIELLVVVVIIGILVAIAIPLYLNYKKGAADKSAESDLRSAISTLELCQTDNGTYPRTAPSTTGTVCNAQKITTSAGTVLAYYPNTSARIRVRSARRTPSAYLLLAWNTNGTTSAENPYCYASASGGSVKRGSAHTAYAASC